MARVEVRFKDRSEVRGRFEGAVSLKDCRFTTTAYHYLSVAAVHTVGKILEGVLGNRSRPHPRGFQHTKHMFGKATHEEDQ